MPSQPPFSARVYAVVQGIPAGKVMTYQDVAEEAGSSRASRAVGTAMKNNPDLSRIPCHRVVGSDGKMRGYAAGEGEVTKMQKLKAEGVAFAGEKVNLQTSRWKGA